MTEVILFSAVAVALIWFLQSAHNPLWEIWARWPRTPVASDLAAKFEGLIRFGQPGAGITLTSTTNHDSVAFSKQSPPGTGEFTLVIHSATSPEVTEIARLALGGSSLLSQPSDEPGYRVSSAEPARLEALTREVVRSLGHSPDERYRIVFRGPADASAVNEYFRLG